jgi:hypothetical protein
MQHIVDPPSVVHQDDMIADHDIAVSPWRRAKTHEQPVRNWPPSSAHVMREHKSFTDIRLPLPVPVPALVVPKVIVMIAVPIARAIAIVVVESVVIVAISIVIVVIAIVIVMVAIVSVIVVMISIVLRPRHPRRAQRQAHQQRCCYNKPSSIPHAHPPRSNL